MINYTKLKVTWLRYSLFIEEVKSLGLLCWELREGATPLHQATRGVVFHVGLGLHLLYSRGTGGGAKQSAEAAGGKVIESQEGNRAERSAGEKQGTGSPTNQTIKEPTPIFTVQWQKACWESWNSWALPMTFNRDKLCLFHNSIQVTQLYTKLVLHMGTETKVSLAPL